MSLHAPVEHIEGQQMIGVRYDTLCGRRVFAPTYRDAEHLLATADDLDAPGSGWDDYCTQCHREALRQRAAAGDDTRGV